MIHATDQRRLKESGLPYTILQPDWFMQNLLRSADSIREEGKLYASIGDGRVGAIDTRDIAQGAGDVVTDTVQKVTGRPPRSFDAFARDYAGAFR